MTVAVPHRVQWTQPNPNHSHSPLSPEEFFLKSETETETERRSSCRFPYIQLSPLKEVGLGE